MRRIKIIFNINRNHLCYEIISILRKYDVAIISMEVYDNVIYLKLPYIDDELMKKLISEWEKVNGYDYIQEIDLMSFEEKDIELQKILNLINQGLIVLDVFGKIQYFNDTADKFLQKLSVNDNISKYINNEKLISCIGDGSNKDEDIRNLHIHINKNTFIISLDKLYSQNNMFFGYLLSIDEVQREAVYESFITFDDIIGKDENIKNIIEIAKLYANSDSAVMLTGESGTGKEMFARAIHSHSKRANMPFVSINCAAIPETLLESELFGYEKGAFTGANRQGRAGIFEVADGGTVFLDEVTEMNYNLQAKLLRVLQEKKIRRIGSNVEKSIDVRIISATNKDVDKLIESERFRLDLFYRLNIFSLRIPPLRERKKDILLLTYHFLKNFEKRYGRTDIVVDDEAMSMLYSYDWAGNIRQMQNVLERAVVLSKDNVITKKQLQFDKARYEICLGSENLTEMVGAYEREVIVKTLKNNKTIRGSAKQLCVTHTLLINRMKKYGIKNEEWK